MSDAIRLRNDDLEWREVDGEIVALDLRTSNYLSVNGVGTRLWDALVTGTTRDAMVERLLGAYDVDRSTAEKDLDAFLTELEGLGLLSDA